MKTLRILKLIAILPAISLLSACGGNSSTATASGNVEIRKIGNLEYGVLEGNLSGDDNQISGSGTLAFRNPLPDEDNGFSAALELVDGASVTFITNADSKLQSGVTLTVSRTSNTINGVIQTSTDSTDVSSFFSGVDATKPFNLDFEVHPHGHLFLKANGQINEYGFSIRPTGRFWGMKLQNGVVRSAVLSSVQED